MESAWAVASSMRSLSASLYKPRASRIDVRAYGNKNLVAPQKTNAMTATIATPKPITVITKGSYAGSLNMANVSEPQHPPAGQKIKSFAPEKFVSANIGRSKQLSLCRARHKELRLQGMPGPGNCRWREYPPDKRAGRLPAMSRTVRLS
jgi:hypothetical protein